MNNRYLLFFFCTLSMIPIYTSKEFDQAVTKLVKQQKIETENIPLHKKKSVYHTAHQLVDIGALLYASTQTYRLYQTHYCHPEQILQKHNETVSVLTYIKYLCTPSLLKTLGKHISFSYAVCGVIVRALFCKTLAHGLVLCGHANLYDFTKNAIKK